MLKYNDASGGGVTPRDRGFRMTSLSEVIWGSWERGLSTINDAVSKGTSVMKHQKRMASDYLGSVMTRNWDKIPDGYITTVDPAALFEVLRIHNDFCGASSSDSFYRYSKIFNQIFYVAKFDTVVVGYSTYYVKPSITPFGLRKCTVLYSMAVDREHRRRGIGQHLLTIGIREMQLNGIDEIFLYVNKRNSPALSLYTKFGFVVIGELPDICKKGESCYKMRLGLSTALT